MNEIVLLSLGFGLFAVVFVAIYAMVSRHRKRIDERLRAFAQRSSWYDLRSERWLAQGIAGSWNGLRVRVRYLPRQKSVPERIDVSIGLSAPVRMIVKRRFPGFLSNKPMALFGPSLVQLPREDMWVRADERTFVDRVLGDRNVSAALSANLVDRYDEVRIGVKGIRIVRALNGQATRAPFGKDVGFRIRRFDAQVLDRELGHAWQLAQSLTGAATR
jgi:hypothetical protein